MKRIRLRATYSSLQMLAITLLACSVPTPKTFAQPEESNVLPTLTTILYPEPCSTCDVYTSRDSVSVTTSSPLATSDREQQTIAPIADTTITSDSDNTGTHATMTKVQPPMFSRPSIPGGPPPFVIPTRPNIEMDDNIDVVIAIVVVVAVLLLVSAIGICGLAIVYKCRSLKRKVEDVGGHRVCKRRGTPWHLYHTEARGLETRVN